MDRKLINEIKLAFDSPQPVGKNEFLSKLSFPKSNYIDFICGQIGYIRKRVWILSGVLIMGVLFGLYFVQLEEAIYIVWIVSSMLPFTALAFVAELSKSASCRMDELEMCCRYSLTDIVLVRSCIIYAFNIFVFIVVLIFFTGKTDYGLLRLGVYAFTPFLLTCALSLAALNRFPLRDSIYVCCGISCFVSIMSGMVLFYKEALFSGRYLVFWGFTFLALVYFTAAQTIKFIKKTEELTWNSQLTA